MHVLELPTYTLHGHWQPQFWRINILLFFSLANFPYLEAPFLSYSFPMLSRIVQYCIGWSTYRDPMGWNYSALSSYDVPTASPCPSLAGIIHRSIISPLVLACSAHHDYPHYCLYAQQYLSMSSLLTSSQSANLRCLLIQRVISP